MPTAILIWVWFCAYLNCAGWALSALHQLNAAGYLVALLMGFVVFMAWRKQTAGRISPRVSWKKLKRRFRRPFPLAFLILAAMACLGGVLYAPSNYDALAYRLPRILHWLDAGQWHWIHTIFPRLNGRACGIEWVSAPFLALLKTDRLLFLINIISFLLMPGLVFSLFTRLDVRRRVAWHWMWIVPTSYGFLLQAGSIGNDLFGAVFALAAVDFALRANHSRSPRDFFASVLAAAMMTSAKTSDLPLLLPWALAVLPSLGWMLRRPLPTGMVCLLALMASFLPTAVLNFKHCGYWSGMVLQSGGFKKDAVVQTGANVVLITIENLVPPVFPLADKWNRGIERALPPKLAERLEQTMESPGCKFNLDQMQIEENAGLGFGVCVLLAASVGAAGWARRKFPAAPKNGGCWSWQAWVRFAPVISLLALVTQSNLAAIARLLVPYYALLLPPLLACAGHERVVMRRWWRVAGFAVFVMAAGLLVVSPPRPLFPVQTLLNRFQTQADGSRLSARTREVYSVYRERNHAFAPAIAVLPPDVKILGLVTFDDPETSLWQPFGSRRVEHVCPGDTSADLKRQGVEYVLVREEVLKEWFKCSLDDWLKQMNARVVQKIPLNLRASKGALDWYLVQLR